MSLGVPAIEGVFDRRLLVNFRIQPDYIDAVLPALLRPQLVKGHAIGGICLIRLKEIRPRGWPKWLTLGSEMPPIASPWSGPTTASTGPACTSPAATRTHA